MAEMVNSDSESPPQGGRGGGENSAGPGDLSSPREQDRFLPIANVSRIMKKSLPANAKISKDAKETVQECVSEFISFVTGEASDKCQREKRKTINGDDLLWAMTTLGFEDYVEPLKVYLHRFRELEAEKTVRDSDGGGGGGVDAESVAGGAGPHGTMLMVGQAQAQARAQQLQGHAYGSGSFHHHMGLNGPGSSLTRPI